MQDVKIDENTFQANTMIPEKVISIKYNVTDIKSQIADLQSRMDVLNALLARAEAVGINVN